MCVDSCVGFSWHHCLADNTLCYLFLVEVANKDKGSTRPTAARRALNRQRTTRDLPSLNDDVRISALIKVVRNARPQLRRQMESLDISDVKAVSDSWGRSAVWWKLMMALMINVGFLTVMRCGELVRLLRLGVILVLHSGRVSGRRPYRVHASVLGCWCCSRGEKVSRQPMPGFQSLVHGPSPSWLPMRVSYGQWVALLPIVFRQGRKLVSPRLLYQGRTTTLARHHSLR